MLIKSKIKAPCTTHSTGLETCQDRGAVSYTEDTNGYEELFLIGTINLPILTINLLKESKKPKQKKTKNQTL